MTAEGNPQIKACKTLARGTFQLSTSLWKTSRKPSGEISECLDIPSEMMTILYRPLGTGPNAFRVCLILQRRLKAMKPAYHDH